MIDSQGVVTFAPQVKQKDATQTQASESVQVRALRTVRPGSSNKIAKQGKLHYQVTCVT
jgi:hypothetical protein